MRGGPRAWFFAFLAVVVASIAGTALAQGPAPTALIGRREVWKYSAGVKAPPDDWKDLTFDDSAWKSGPAGFGYGDGDDATILDEMRNRYTAVFIRKQFDLDRLEGIDTLYLSVNYDDGFIAYLNGKQVASASVVKDGDGLHVEQHEAEGVETFVIADAKALLRPGKNVLAIEGHNVSPDSSDFSLDPSLSTRPPEGHRLADFFADVDELERRLLDQSSYLTRLGFDHSKALNELRRSLTVGTRLPEFVLSVQKLVMQIGDCHAGVQSGTALPSTGFLPIRPADTSEGIAALAIDSDRPIDRDCPYLESIDGEPLDRWLEAAARFVPRGSPQLVRRRSLEWLGRAETIRRELKLDASDTVTIGLRSSDGARHATRKLRLSNQGYGIAQVPRQGSRLLEGNLGYLRIPVMDDRLVEPTVAQIERFRETRGLIIDVRDNGGGNYGLMRGIYGFFVPEGSKPRITNVAAYRLGADFASDHLAYRPTYRADWEGWNDEELAAIRRVAETFRPEWPLPPGKFSDWHYMILGRGRSGRAGPAREIFYYQKPVVVLSNAGSFSATDGFLNAFADLPGVTLVGEPSGGGSGATRQFVLPKTRVIVALSSMASFRPDGRLFDGRGIEVDVPVKPKLEDYIGGVDNVLARGVAVIVERSK